MYSDKMQWVKRDFCSVRVAHGYAKRNKITSYAIFTEDGNKFSDLIPGTVRGKFNDIIK